MPRCRPLFRPHPCQVISDPLVLHVRFFVILDIIRFVHISTLSHCVLRRNSLPSREFRVSLLCWASCLQIQNDDGLAFERFERCLLYSRSIHLCAEWACFCFVKKVFLYFGEMYHWGVLLWVNCTWTSWSTSSYSLNWSLGFLHRLRECVGDSYTYGCWMAVALVVVPVLLRKCVGTQTHTFLVDHETYEQTRTSQRDVLQSFKFSMCFWTHASKVRDFVEKSQRFNSVQD